jgi:lipid II:glycine glycyltransferase (peptidoglycan interpeptide bridge formation enzyme)
VGFRHELALDGDPAEIMARFDRSQVQRGIRKAHREGVRVRWGSSRGDVEVFYSLHLATRRRLGVPIQPRAFFDGLWERLLEPGLGAIVISEIDDRPVAAAVFLGWRDTLVYKFGASDRDAWSYRPNHALFWDAIRWACEKGFAVLDFGRTDLDNDGLRGFKGGWGTLESPLVYSTLGELRPVRAGGAAAKALGGLIRHSPEIVCRQLGERFYRYVA